MENLVLSQDRIAEMFSEGEALTWAKKVYGREELSEEEVAFSSAINDVVGRAYKLGSTVAKEEIAEVVMKIIEPEVFSAPNEILAQMFDTNEYGEFDKVEVRRSYKNTLIAHESAERTGNVDKSYIDVSVGNSTQKHLQIETEIPMSNLRRDGALGVATLAIFALQAFDYKKFEVVMNFVDSLIVGGENAFEYTGEPTKLAVDDFTGYLNDYCFEGSPTAVGLSNTMRAVCRSAGVENWYSEAMKDKINQVTMLDVYNGTLLNSIKAGKKMGDGSTLIPADKVIGFAGKIGEYFTKGELRTLVTNDNNSETISIKFTGVEFGVCIDKPEKIAKLYKA